VVKVSSYSLNEGPQPFALVVNFQRSSGMNYTSCPEVTYLACDSYLEDATVTVELVLNHPEFSASSWENDVASLMAIAANERVANARLVPGHNASSPNTVNFIMKDVKLDCRPRQQTRWNPDLRQPSPLPGGRTAARDGSQPQLRRLLAARELHALHVS